MDASLKLLALRRSDRCCRCERELAAGTRAYWDKQRRTVTCLDCGSPPAPPTTESTAGASARAEYERRREARESGLREDWGRLGAVIAWWSDGPQSERAWARGAAGEEKNAARFEELLSGRPVVLLHDRRVPGSRSNIDHIAVGPGGITVVDSKNLKGKVRVDWSGGLFSPRRPDLYMSGRNRTALVDAIERQVEVVRKATGAGIPIAAALCMADVDGLPLRKVEVRGVLIDGPKPVAGLMARPGHLGESAIEEIAVTLERELPPAETRTNHTRHSSLRETRGLEWLGVRPGVINATLAG